MKGIKFIDSQAKSIHHYKSLRSKILYALALANLMMV